MTITLSDEQANELKNWEDHLRVLKGLGPSSVRAYRRFVEEFLTWRDGNALTGPVTREDVENYLKWCFYRKGNGNNTRVTKLVSLQTYYRWRIYRGLQTDDPTAIPRPRLTKKFMLAFTKQEILKMCAVCDITTQKGLRDTCFLILGAFCGFRVSEIRNLNIEDVQDDGKELDIVIPRTKHGAGRAVYLWQAPAYYVRALLLSRVSQGARTGDALLTGFYKGDRPITNRRLSTRTLDTLIKTLARRANIRKAAVKCHMLRAAHANDLQHIKGYTLSAIMERLGWQDLTTATRYLVRRERIHRECRSLHEYWIEFTKVWTTNMNTNQAE